MQILREWLIQDLKTLSAKRFAVDQMTSELNTLEIEYKGIKASNYDDLPSNTGVNKQLEKIEWNLARRETLTAALEATKSHVANMERLLSQLSDKDKEIIEKMIVEDRTAEQLAEYLGIETRQIFNRKRDAIERLLYLRFGDGYKP